MKKDLLCTMILQKARFRINALMLAVLLLLIPYLTKADPPVKAAERPNFVILVSEDNSVHYMDHFYPGGAVTPNIESLAEGGITFDRAFANAPVCSAARTTVINSVYGPRTATLSLSQCPRVGRCFPIICVRMDTTRLNRGHNLVINDSYQLKEHIKPYYRIQVIQGMNYLDK